MGKLKWLVAALAAAVVLVVGGTWVYINVIRDDPPERLDAAFDPDPSPDDPSDGDPATEDPATDGSQGSEGSDPTTPVAPLESVDGTWSPTSGSLVGYRVGEVLFGQTAEGVGRTDQVAGQVVISGTTVTEAAFEVDMASIESDDDRRDDQFRGRIMDVAAHPTATLVLAEPIELGRIRTTSRSSPPPPPSSSRCGGPPGPCRSGSRPASTDRAWRSAVRWRSCSRSGASPTPAPWASPPRTTASWSSS